MSCHFEHGRVRYTIRLMHLMRIEALTSPVEGKTTTATVVDLCPSCGGRGVDVTEPVFAKLADVDRGRIKGVTWEFA